MRVGWVGLGGMGRAMGDLDWSAFARVDHVG
jgi:hypothetical protein